MVLPAPKKKTKPVPAVPPKKKVIPPPPPPLATLTVEVVEVLTGNAIKNATVEVQGVETKPTGGNGKVTFKPRPPGTVNILVRKDKHGPVPAAKGDPFTPGVNVTLTGVVLVAGPKTITVKMCDGTGQLLVRARRVVSNALVALPKAEIEVVGQRKAEAPDDGELFFKSLPAGKFSVKVRKAGYGPQRKKATDTFAFGEGAKEATVPPGHPEQIDIEMENPGNTVTKIFAVIKDTAGLVAAPALAGETAAPAGSQRLKSSTSNSLSLSLTGPNPPVVLVRGCNKVTLTATTNPAGKGVGWQVKPNENKSAAPALAISGDAQSATLSTDKGGSFAVIAADGEVQIVWNVVFAHLKVDVKSSVVKTQRTFYKNVATSPGFISVGSGNFVTNQAAWQATVTMQVIGGGADGSVGAPKINIHYFQNGVTGVNDAGAYTGPPAAAGGANVVGAVTETPPNLPILDATGPGGGPVPPNAPLVADVTNPVPPPAPPAPFTPVNATPIIFGASAILTPLGNRKFKLQSLDSPGVAFSLRHPTKAAMIRSIAGQRAFRAAVAATSQDAVNNLVVVADLSWQATYNGTVAFPAGSPAAPALVPGATTATWTGTTNNAIAPAQYTLVSDATGGQDAAVAGFRITPPRFNHPNGFRLVPS